MKLIPRILASLCVAVLAVYAYSGPALADSNGKVTFIMTTKAISPGHATFTSLQKDPAFWEQQGLDVEIVSVGGSTIAVQQIANGNAEFATVSPSVLISARAKGIPIKAYYAIVPSTIFRVAVPAASSISSPKDLKGTTIGIPSEGSTPYKFARILVSSAGLDPDKDVNWLSVGIGSQAALALKRDQVQSLSTWDTMQASFENTGMEFKQITAPYVDSLIGQLLITSEDFLKDNPDTAKSLAKGIAMGTIFALENPEQTVKNHWKFYPNSKPQQGSEEQKLENAVHIMNARLGLMKVEGWPDTPYGRIDPKVWESTVNASVEQGDIPSADVVGEAYTNEFISEINDFSKSDVLSQTVSVD